MKSDRDSGMSDNSFLNSILLIAFAILSATATIGAKAAVLWNIGEKDDANREFALAPKSFGQFKADGFYVIGESDAKRDWPYVQPGPADRWAGDRSHTFVILFGLKQQPQAGDCVFGINVLDTEGAPKLRIEVNGSPFERALSAGNGERSIKGDVSKGKRQAITVSFPSDLLRAGDNEIRITTVEGSWLLYDNLSLTTPEGAETGPVHSRTVVDDISTSPGLVEKNGQYFQPVVASFRHFGQPTDATVRIGNGPSESVHLTGGVQKVSLLEPEVTAPVKRTVTVEIAGDKAATRDITLKPIRHLTVYILPHSHTDIGYTAIQTDIEKKQVNNLVQGIAEARRTASYPEGARFIWNVEVLWAADLYLHRLNEQQRADFLDAVKKGQVVLNGMYLNELTGLCRPEELVRLFRYAPQLAEKTGATIDSAMISDVPGYTWGTVPAMAQAGIKYFSTAPNYFDRIGTILREWENKPFYWVGPDGKSKVLVWIPFWGYAMSHRYGQLSEQLVRDFYDGLDKRNYPYDIAHLRWSGHGDNAVPDPVICEFVKDWNAKYAWPKFIISGTGEAFQALEKKYGDKLPLVRGDWTPYWEDGAGSSSLETAMNRQSSDRLAQAETLLAMRDPKLYQPTAFEEAWNNVLLYSEHTWGAWCSISEPERKETVEQWAIKKSYADLADRQSKELFAKALDNATQPSSSGVIEIINTLSWERTELVTVGRELSTAGDRVCDEKGKPVPSQRLASGELVFLAKAVPPFASKKYVIKAGRPQVEGAATASENILDSGIVKLRVNLNTGGIAELTANGVDGNFADVSGGETLNDYLYLPADDLKDVRRNGPVKISAGEKGPLVASLIIESEAPGCKALRRELRVRAGGDYVEVINLVDKARIPGRDYHAKESKESVNFAFPFNVPDGDILLDLPLGVMRPEDDQMPSACKNWFTVGRWADVSNRDRGITWVTLDAPLVQIGGLTANLLNSQTNPDTWRKKVERTQKIYSWAMNNHWGTNYRAYQEGPTIFRFVLRPHRQSNPAEASRFATGFSQPMLVRTPKGDIPAKSRLKLSSEDVLVSGFKPSDDGKALIVRLFNASANEARTQLTWAKPQPKQMWLSDTSEKPVKQIGDSMIVPPWGLVTVRAELAGE